MVSGAPWLGERSRGAREFTDSDVGAVRAYLRSFAIGKKRALRQEQIGNDLRLPGRTVRAVLADLDGVDFVLAYDSERRVFIAEYVEDAERYSAELDAKTRTMLKRLDRRRQLTDRLPPEQQPLF